MKDNFIRDVEIAMSLKGFPRQEIDKAVQCIIGCLDNYEVTEKTTEITVRYDDINERMLKQYVACMKLDGKSDGTIKGYMYTLKRLSDCVNKPYNEMSANDIRYFLLSISEGRKNSYIKSQKSNITTFFKWMKVEDITEKNVCEKLADIKCEKEVRLPFSAVDIDRLRSSINGRHALRDRAIIEVLLSSGVRCAELCALNIDDVNLIEKTMYVRKGKGGKGRIVYISDVAAEYLNKYLKHRKDTDTCLWRGQRGPLMVYGVQYMLKEYGKTAGVDNVHPHRFRRTFATTMNRRGMPLDEIRRLMGHSEVQTTLAYIYTDESQLKAAYEKYVA